jgi:hypothetical protein
MVVPERQDTPAGKKLRSYAATAPTISGRMGLSLESSLILARPLRFFPNRSGGGPSGQKYLSGFPRARPTPARTLAAQAATRFYRRPLRAASVCLLEAQSLISGPSL